MSVSLSSGFTPGSFAARLAAINHLFAIGFDRFLFLSGMEFGSKEKWWGAAGRRTFSHEGVDLCLFRTRDNVLYRLDETIRVPLIYSGKIVGLIPDFLGRTVIVRHRMPDVEGEADFYTLYGHVSPVKDLAVGDTANAGDIFADIAKADVGSNGLPAHLHVSAAWCRRLPPADTLTWPLLNQWDRSAFIDPLTLMGIAYEPIKLAAAGPLYQISKCGSVRMS